MNDNNQNTQAEMPLLHKLWHLVLNHLIKIMESPNPSAAHVEQARKFLVDNNVSKDMALPQGLQELRSSLSVPFPQ